jgi:endonuclease/exonuclease/phosphatase (EEP) superfamily protein YafD
MLTILVSHSVKWMIFALNLATFAAFLGTMLGFAGRIWWGFELLDHPRTQYCLLLVLAMIAGAITGKTITDKSVSFIWCMPIALNLGLILPLFFSPPLTQDFKSVNISAIPNLPHPNLQILHANLDRDNQHFSEAIAYLKNQPADIILLQGVTPQWLTELAASLTDYRLVISRPLNNTQGVAMFVANNATSVEIMNTEIIHLPEGSDRPMISSMMRFFGKKISLLSLHTIRSRTQGNSAYQEQEFSAAAQWIQRQLKANREVIIIGDFNSTPWSGRFRQFARGCDLINSQKGYGLQPTCLAGFSAFLMIPIDHCLHS